MVDFNPLLPAVRTNPYPTYEALREEEPVYWSELMQAWLLTAYDDVVAVLRDHGRFSSDRTRANNRFIQAMEAQRQQSTPLSRAATMLSVDPPDHTRLRALVQKAFSPRLIDDMEGRIASLTEELLDRVARRGRMDLVRDFALPIPTTIIAEMLGVPVRDRHKFHRWSSRLIAANSRHGILMAIPSTWRFMRYIRKMIAARRDRPKDDLVTALVQARDEGQKLSDDELELLQQYSDLRLPGAVFEVSPSSPKFEPSLRPGEETCRLLEDS